MHEQSFRILKTVLSQLLVYVPSYELTHLLSTLNSKGDASQHQVKSFSVAHLIALEFHVSIVWPAAWWLVGWYIPWCFLQHQKHIIFAASFSARQSHLCNEFKLELDSD